MLQTLDDALSLIRDRSIEMVDLKFCDLWGRWHHVTLPSERFGPHIMERGIGFDGSSVGFKALSSGDMVLVPDLSTAFVDPFWEAPTLSFICTTLEADTRDPFPYDPRSITRRAEGWLRECGVATNSVWGPELEFYVFSGVAFENTGNTSAYRVESVGEEEDETGLGDGFSLKRHGGYHAIPPGDRFFNFRARICAHLKSMGAEVKYHHHEVGAAGQCEIEPPLMGCLQAADVVQLIKYATRMTAAAQGLTATFIPKPLYGAAGSGMHFHQRLERDGVNLFFDAEGYASMSELAHSYVAGLLHHGGALLAFTNPSTNSYRRLVPGFEAPVSAVFSAGNRSAAVRIPSYANSPDSARIEFRPPDATANPYLAIAVQLMAGIDGIRRKLDPSELGFGPVDEDIFSWSRERLGEIKALPTTLDEAADALETDHDFLLEGGVFSEELIAGWVARKRQEQRDVRDRPHPYEVELYYDL